MKRISIVFVLFLAIVSKIQAYTVEQPSPTTPVGTEASWVAFSTSTQSPFLFTAQVNQFFPNTWNMVLMGPNPFYNPPPSAQQLMNDMVTISSYNYLNGWGNGESYNQFLTTGLLQNTTDSFLVGCSTTPANLNHWFTISQSSLATFDKATCEDVVNSIAAVIYNMQASTPTVVPGNWQ